MLTTFLVLIILSFLLIWSLSWIKYYNRLDERLGKSLWRWSYDYPVKGERDISLLDDEKFVILRRKKNKSVTIMYFILFFSFIVVLSLVTQIIYEILI